ncbi:MAG: hypothetical protein IJP52_05670 [Paludibacteraceae bacterium]|nr:hypothetical protein [Paludibacteraceae bacterium]
MKWRYTYIVLLLLLSLSVGAKGTVQTWDSLRHEVRIGWGDLLFESATQYEFPHIGRPNIRTDYITGHLFAEYQYSWLRWLSTGMIVDFSGMGWHDRRDNSAHNYYNLSFLPAVRFTWYRHPWVQLYSAVFAGLTINGGSEKDLVRGKYTICYPGWGLTAFGMQVGQKGWFGALEIGGLYALNNMDDIVMLSSRMLTVSIGYRWQ